MTVKRTIAFVVLVGIATSGQALAACSDADAYAKVQEFSALATRKMAAQSDAMGDLMSEFGDMMAETAGKVTEQTCRKLDELIRKASRL